MADELNSPDFTIKVLRKTTTKKGTTGKPLPPKAVRALNDDDLPAEADKPKKVSAQLRREIVFARTSKDPKMTQADLARACSIPLIIIKSYEDGTTVPKIGEVRKMERALGTEFSVKK